MGTENKQERIPKEIFREIVEGRLGDFLQITHRETREHRRYLIIYPDHIYRVVPEEDLKIAGDKFIFLKDEREMKIVYDLWKRKTYLQNLKGGERR